MKPWTRDTIHAYLLIALFILVAILGKCIVVFIKAKIFALTIGA